MLQCVAVCVAAYMHYIFGSSEPLHTVFVGDEEISHEHCVQCSWFVGDEEIVRGAGSSAQVCVCMCVCVWKRLLQCVAVCCSVLRTSAQSLGYNGSNARVYSSDELNARAYSSDEHARAFDPL